MVVVLIIIAIVVYFVVKASKKSLFKRNIINTFYYMSSSLHDTEHRRVCKFYHDEYNDGNHMIKIEISDSQTMQFNLVSKPVEVGNTLMFNLASIDNRITGIDLMMLEDSAYIKYPDGSMVNFR